MGLVCVYIVLVCVYIIYNYRIIDDIIFWGLELDWSWIGVGLELDWSCFWGFFASSGNRTRGACLEGVHVTTTPKMRILIC